MQEKNVQRGQKNNPINCSGYTPGTKKPPLEFAGALYYSGYVGVYHHCRTTPTIQSITVMKVIAAIIQSCQSIIPQPPCALLRYKMRPLLPLSNTNHQGQNLCIHSQSCHSNRSTDAASYPCRHSCRR